MSNETTFFEMACIEVAKELHFVIEGKEGRTWEQEDKFTKDVVLMQAEKAIIKYEKLLKDKNGNI
jgi:hypothetical protein